MDISQKRKKRKSRRCLDELRKRSRGVNKPQLHYSDKQNYKFGVVSKCYFQNNLITNDRLTLNIFHKAIQSDTITRPALAELKQKINMNLNDSVKLSKFLSLNNKGLSTPDFISSGNDNYECLNKENKNHTHSDVFYNSKQFSENSDISVNSYIVKPSDRSGTVRYKSSSTQYENYDLYKEFVSEIPKYLKCNTLQIDDVMGRTKTYLENIFIKSYHKENYSNLNLSCLKFSPEFNKAMLIKPMEYIRLSHIDTQSGKQLGVSTPKCCKVNCSIESPLSTSDISDSLGSFVVKATPDYTFYPHKLN